MSPGLATLFLTLQFINWARLAPSAQQEKRDSTQDSVSHRMRIFEMFPVILAIVVVRTRCSTCYMA